MNSFFKPRTIFALMFYGTACYLLILGREVPEPLKNVVIMLLSFYFGSASKKEVNNGSTKMDNK